VLNPLGELSPGRSVFSNCFGRVAGRITVLLAPDGLPALLTGRVPGRGLFPVLETAPSWQETWIVRICSLPDRQRRGFIR